jgi:hypothetical protein
VETASSWASLEVHSNPATWEVSTKVDEAVVSFRGSSERPSHLHVDLISSLLSRMKGVSYYTTTYIPLLRDFDLIIFLLVVPNHPTQRV